MDPDVLPAEFTNLGAPVEITVGASETRVSKEFWGSLDGRYRPGLDLQVLIPVDVGMGTEAGPPVESVDVTTLDSRQPSRSSNRVRSFVEEGSASPPSPTGEEG
jgi:hypothetical protein